MLNIIDVFPADGIAMGSASTSTEAEIQIVVFIAIMLHKVYFYSVDS